MAYVMVWALYIMYVTCVGGLGQPEVHHPLPKLQPAMRIYDAVGARFVILLVFTMPYLQ